MSFLNTDGKQWDPPCTNNEQYKVCDSGTHRFFVIIVILLIFLSCGYSYLDSRNQINNIQIQKNRYMEEIMNLKVDIAYNTILDIGRYEGKAAELMAQHVADDIREAYKNDMSVLQDRFTKGIFSDSRFNGIVMKTILGEHNINELNDHRWGNGGYLVFVQDKLLYNQLFSGGDAFATNIDDIVHKSYNKFLTYDFIDMIRDSKSGIHIIEPNRAMWGNTHYMMTNLTYENIYNMLKDEGLDGLTGYYVVNFAYIHRDKDIFGVSDYDENGYRTNNFKITIVPYISLYNYIMQYRKPYLNSIDELEQLVNSRAESATKGVYLTSISSLIIHMAAIFLILKLSGTLFFRNLIDGKDLSSIKKKLKDRTGCD